MHFYQISTLTMKFSQKINFNEGVFEKKNILNDGDFT
jgi:hypothetical protein